jgi:hypothetical protein
MVKVVVDRLENEDSQEEGLGYSWLCIVFLRSQHCAGTLIVGPIETLILLL